MVYHLFQVNFSGETKMPKAKYENIYKEIKQKILSHEYESGDYLPSENDLTEKYNCSRNTIRKATLFLIEEGLVQPHHGKGVRVIYHESQRYNLTRSGISGFSQSAEKSGYRVTTQVINFTELVADGRLSQKTYFPEGTTLYFIQRVRYLNGTAKSLDTTLLRKDLIPGLTPEIAAGSLFDYIENVVGMEIRTIKRSITISHISELDKKYLKIEDYDCTPVITSRNYNLNGEMFEYTESRNNPDSFQFNSVAWR